jgi:hypothetical protein
MTTGSAWNTDNPNKPWASFDADAVRDIPFEWDLWLADIGSVYLSHTITTDPELECVNPTSGELTGVIKARIQAAPGQVLTIGTKYKVRCHIIAANGEEDDQTLYLKIAEK